LLYGPGHDGKGVWAGGAILPADVYAAVGDISRRVKRRAHMSPSRVEFLRALLGGSRRSDGN